MRFLIAAALFVASLVSLLLGIGDRTLWAPPADHRISINVETKSPFIIVPAEVLSSFPGQPTVSVTSLGRTFAALGRESDIRAWVGNAQYLELAADKTGAGLPIIKKGAEHIGISGTSPQNSDLWIVQQAGAGSASVSAVTRSDTGALIASDGKAPAPTQLLFVWPIAHDLTFSNTMIDIGIALMVAAVVMFIIASRHARIKRGPRRRTPKAPKVKKVRVRRNKSLVKPKGRRSARNPIVQRAAAGLLAAAVSASLAGCSLQLPGVAGGAASASPKVSSTANNQTPAAVTHAQLERILVDVAAVAAQADETKNRALLSSRFAGPAFKLRAINYILRKKSSAIEPLPSIAAAPITFSLPASTDTWPRVIMAVTDEPGQANLPQMIVLQQASPRDNYKVWYVSRLLPGVKIPAVATEDMGAIPVDPKSVFLKLAPNQLAQAFGDVINRGRTSLSAGLFNLSNPFYEQVSSDQKAQAAALVNAKITYKHTLGEPNTMALATADAGALVAVFMNDTYTIKPSRPGSAVAVDGAEKVLLGTGGSTTGVQSVYGDMLFFYVPPVTSKSTIELLGATQGLLAIKKL